MKMKKIGSALLACILMFCLAACGQDQQPSDSDNSDTSKTDVQVSGLTEPIAETPAIITSAGQSADAAMLSALLDKAGFSCELRSNLEPEHFEPSEYKTLIVAVGGSQKGLGAAGVDANAEQARVDGIIQKAEDAGLIIIVAHIGGDARRGDLSDGFINAVSPKADYLLVVAGGNNDDLFTNIALDNDIPLDIVDKLGDAGTVLIEAFK